MTENRKTFSSDALWFMPFWQVGLMLALALFFSRESKVRTDYL